MKLGTGVLFLGILALLLAAAGPWGASVRADDSDLADTLQQVMRNGLAAYDREDVEGTLAYVHTKSPEYDRMKTELTEQFRSRDLAVQLVDFRYIGHDDEFAVARVHIKTAHVDEQPFTDNVIDTITVFHQENGKWKFWSDQLLGVEMVK